jgi:hypothetical protein
MEDWAAAFDSAQQPTKPPESPEEESMIKNDWMKYFSHPAVSQGLLQMGTALLQPMQPGETFAGRFSSSMSKGAETIGNAAEQNFGMEQKAEQKTYDRGRDAKSDARADAEAKRAGAGLSLAERKFQYDQSQNELARDDAKTAAQQAAELDRLKIASGVYEKLVANTTAGTPPEEINQMAQDIFSQMQGMTGAKSAINPQVAGSDVVGEVAQPTTSGGQGSVTSGGEPPAGQEVTAPTNALPENIVNALKKSGVREKILARPDAATASGPIFNEIIGKVDPSARARVMQYLQNGE